MSFIPTAYPLLGREKKLLVSLSSEAQTLLFSPVTNERITASMDSRDGLASTEDVTVTMINYIRGEPCRQKRSPPGLAPSR